MVKDNNNNNSSNSLVFGRWPQTKTFGKSCIEPTKSTSSASVHSLTIKPWLLRSTAKIVDGKVNNLKSKIVAD